MSMRVCQDGYMLTEAKLLEILTKWNFWDRSSIKAGFLREITEDIIAYSDGPEVIALKGVRRSHFLLNTGVIICLKFFTRCIKKG